MTLGFDGVIIGMIISALKRSRTSSLSVTSEWWQNTWIFLFKVKFGH